MGYFPFFTDVTKLQGIIIGGGHIALEKVQRLAEFQAKIIVVAPAICDEIKQFQPDIKIIEDSYKKYYMEEADYVIAATDNRALNEEIYHDAKKRNLLVNVVDVPDLCDFIFPSVTKRGRLVIGVSSSGAGPQVAIRLRKEIEGIIPDNIEEILDYLAEERIRAKEEIQDPGERRKYLINLADKLLAYEKQ